MCLLLWVCSTLLMYNTLFPVCIIFSSTSVIWSSRWHSAKRCQITVAASHVWAVSKNPPLRLRGNNWFCSKSWWSAKSLRWSISLQTRWLSQDLQPTFTENKVWILLYFWFYFKNFLSLHKYLNLHWSYNLICAVISTTLFLQYQCTNIINPLNSNVPWWDRAATQWVDHCPNWWSLPKLMITAH